jgi:hypothetical protein
MANIITISEIQSKSRGHFFDPATTRFFKSRYPQTGIEHDNKVYFITSEQFDYKSARLYTIRYLDRLIGDIETYGQFQAYETSRQAQSAINKIIKS